MGDNLDVRLCGPVCKCVLMHAYGSVKVSVNVQALYSLSMSLAALLW